MTMKYVIASCLFLVAVPAFAATPAKAPVNAPTQEKLDNASEAVHLFKTLCVDTKGDATKAAASIDPFIKAGVAAKLPDDKAEEFSGTKAKAAWVLQSPETKQRLMVVQRADGTCAMYVNQAPQNKIRDDFSALVAWVSGTSKGGVGGKTTKKEVEDHEVTNDFFEVVTDKASERIALAISSSQEPHNDTQHILTYSRISAKAKK